MAHGVEKMFAVRKAPWHKLGVLLDSPPTIEEGIRIAGLDWKVERRPMKYIALDGSMQDASTRAVVRRDTGAKLGEVGPAWTPLQNDKAFSFFQPFLDAHEAALECAGSLFGGEKVFVLAKIGGTDEIVKGDAVERYILLSNSHSGGAVFAGFTPTRVVCNNTLQMAVGNKAGALLKLRHVQSIEDALDVVQKTMVLANSRFEATAAQYRALAKVACSDSRLAELVQVVFKPQKETEPEAEEQSEDKDTCSRVLPSVEMLFSDGAGSEIPGVRGTLWGAYNAITEYLTHERGRSAERRLANLWFGQGATLNHRALTAALGMAKAA